MSPDFIFLWGTKQAEACAQGSVNQRATWQFYGLCFLLQELDFLFFLTCNSLNSSFLNCLQFWAFRLGFCMQNLSTFLHTSFQVTRESCMEKEFDVLRVLFLMPTMVVTRKSGQRTVAVCLPALCVQVERAIENLLATGFQSAAVCMVVGTLYGHFS